MNDYEVEKKNQLEKKYFELKDEFETYQNFAESTIQRMNKKNIKLEKKLDAITNIVEISKYINSFLSNKDLISMINDMIIGILGATYSSIYIIEDDKLVIKATNVENLNYNFYEDEEYKELFNGKYFIINSQEPLLKCNNLKNEIHSLISVPIYIREELLGYIVVKHTLNNFFRNSHVNFISTIVNQVAIALENNSLYNKIKEMAIRDPLIGIYNRKYFFNKVEEEIHKNPSRCFAIVMMDVDDFKEVNDLYGHQVGDMVLKKTGNIIIENLNKSSILGRYGGEEIIIYIYDYVDIIDVYNKIDSIRIKISKNTIQCKECRVGITASFGVGYYPEDGDNLNSIIKMADSRLYIAKNTSKNKVIYN